LVEHFKVFLDFRNFSTKPELKNSGFFYFPDFLSPPAGLPVPCGLCASKARDNVSVCRLKGTNMIAQGNALGVEITIF